MQEVPVPRGGFLLNVDIDYHEHFLLSEKALDARYFGLLTTIDPLPKSVSLFFPSQWGIQRVVRLSS